MRGATVKNRKSSVKHKPADGALPCLPGGLTRFSDVVCLLKEVRFQSHRNCPLEMEDERKYSSEDCSGWPRQQSLKLRLPNSSAVVCTACRSPRSSERSCSTVAVCWLCVASASTSVSIHLSSDFSIADALSGSRFHAPSFPCLCDLVTQRNSDVFSFPSLQNVWCSWESCLLDDSFRLFALITWASSRRKRNVTSVWRPTSVCPVDILTVIPWLTRGQHETWPAYIAARQKGGPIHLLYLRVARMLWNFQMFGANMCFNLSQSVVVSGSTA